jgi:hypothetical protein
LFKHITRPICFILVVNNFGLKFVSKDDVNHLINHLKKKYKLTTDWEGKLFQGITLNWDYIKRTVQLSMPHYVEKALLRFHHPTPIKPQHSPHQWDAPIYGAKTQFTAPTDPNFKQLTRKEKTYVQEVIGTFLFYAWAIDSTMLPILDYASTHPNASVKYVASQMQLWAHSDASYLCKSKQDLAQEASISSATNPLSPSKLMTPSPLRMALSTSFVKSLTPSCLLHKKPKQEPVF